MSKNRLGKDQRNRRQRRKALVSNAVVSNLSDPVKPKPSNKGNGWRSNERMGGSTQALGTRHARFDDPMGAIMKAKTERPKGTIERYSLNPFTGRRAFYEPINEERGELILTGKRAGYRLNPRTGKYTR